MRLFYNWIISALAIIIASYLLPGVTTESFFTALVVAIVLGLVNTFIRPLLILMTLPATLMTLGLFTLVINAFLVWLVQAIVPGFEIDNFGWAFLFAILLSLINVVFRSMDRKDEGRPHGQNHQDRRTVEGRVIS